MTPFPASREAKCTPIASKPSSAAAKSPRKTTSSSSSKISTREENPKYFLTLSAEGFEIVRSVGNPHVKFLYDFFHEQIADGNLIAKLEKNIDLVGLVHVADVPGRHDPGTGEIYYPNIFRKLGELGYSRYVAMEFMPKGEPIAALRAAREMALKFGRSGKKQSSNASFREVLCNGVKC